MHGVVPLQDSVRISAVKPKRPSGYARAKKKKGGVNVMWKRIQRSYYEDLRQHGADPAMVSPLSRWVIYQHISDRQGYAGRRYALIVRRFERYCLPSAKRSACSANLEPLRAHDQEIERRIAHGTIDQYETDAKIAKREYRKAMKILDNFADNLTGRNLAKDMLDLLCLSEEEPPAQYRKDLGVVLTALAKAFGVDERR